MWHLVAIIFMIFLRINWPNLVQFAQQRPIGDQNFVVIHLRRIRIEWRWSQKDGLNWVFSLPHAHLLNQKAAVLHFTRVYTVCLQYMQLRNIGKKHSLPYQSNSNVLYFQLCHCFTFNQGTIYRENLYQKSLGVLLPASLNDDPDWVYVLLLFLLYAAAFLHSKR